MKNDAEAVALTVSNLIQELRESRQMTRPQLARHARISRAHLWAIENRRIAPGISTLEKISEVFGVGVGRFFKSDVEFLLEHYFVRSVRGFLPYLNSGHRQLILKTLQAAPRNSRGGSR